MPNHWTLVLDKESSGGQTTRVERIENYPSLTELKSPVRTKQAITDFFYDSTSIFAKAL